MIKNHLINALHPALTASLYPSLQPSKKTSANLPLEPTEPTQKEKKPLHLRLAASLRYFLLEWPKNEIDMFHKKLVDLLYKQTWPNSIPSYLSMISLLPTLILVPIILASIIIPNILTVLAFFSIILLCSLISLQRSPIQTLKAAGIHLMQCISPIFNALINQIKNYCSKNPAEHTTPQSTTIPLTETDLREKDDSGAVKPQGTDGTTSTSEPADCATTPGP